MEAIPFDLRGMQVQLRENFAKREAGGGGARAAGARDCDHWMFGRHNNSLIK